MRQMISCAIVGAILASVWYYQTQASEQEKQLHDAASVEDMKPLYWAVSQAFYPPFAQRDSQGIMTGLDVDLLMAIAEKEHFDVSIRPHASNGLLQTLDKNDADIVMSGIQITPERARQYGLTKPYLHTQWAILNNARQAEITQIGALNQKRVAILDSKTIKDKLTANAPNAHIVGSDGVYRSVTAVQSGHVDAAFDLQLVLNNYASNSLRVSPLKSLGKVSVGFAVRKDNPLLRQKLDKGLIAIKKDGTYDRILKKWGVENK